VKSPVVSPPDPDYKVNASTRVNISPDSTSVYELVLELDENGGVYNISDTLDEIITIADLSDPRAGTTAYANQFYVRDINVANRNTESQSSKSVEIAHVEINVNLESASFNANFLTDHNGYGYFGRGVILTGTDSVRPQIYSGENELKDFGDNTMLQGYNLSDVVDGSVGLEPSVKSDLASGTGTIDFIIMANNGLVRDNSRTRIEGIVKDSEGNPVSGALITVDRTNEHQRTDSSGFYDILVFSESDNAGTTDTRNATVFINADISECNVDDDPLEAAKKDVNLITINSSAPPNYNDNEYFDNGTITIAVRSYSSYIALKRGGVYQWGIVYMDDYLRSSLVATSDALRVSIPYYTDDLNDFYPSKYPTDNTFRYGDPIINWEIKSAPPSWATQYFWVRTKNTAANFYLQWIAYEIQYVKNYNSDVETFVPTTYENGDATEIYISIENILKYQERNTDSQLGYTWVEGDKLIIIQNGGSYLTDYIELEIKGQRGNYVVVDYIGSIPKLEDNLIFEIYTPKLQVDSEIFYEFGPCYKIENGFHKGGTQDQTGAQPAKGTFSGGDTYKLARTIPIETGQDVIFTYDSASISDAIVTGDSSIGRPNIQNKDFREQLRASTVRFSNPLVQDSFVNGIPSFETLDELVIGDDRGSIQKMVATTDNILVIHERESTILRIREAFLNTPDGAGILSQTNKVIGDKYELRGEFGTRNPESVVEFDDVIYWYDSDKSEPIRYSNNGLTPLGKNLKFKDFFLNVEKTREAYRIANPGAVDRVYGGYDPEKDVFVLSFNDLGDGNQYAPMFAERPNVWIGQVSYFAENFVNIGNYLYSFKDGVLWEHDKDDVNHNVFYGVQHFPKFKLVSNKENLFEKIYRGVGIKSNQPWDTPSITNPDGQSSKLFQANFYERDDEYYADFLRDENTNPDQLTGAQTPLTHGHVLRSQVLEVEFSTDKTGKIFVEDITVRYQRSPGHHIDNSK
jgi:hypothetical protein